MPDAAGTIIPRSSPPTQRLAYPAAMTFHLTLNCECFLQGGWSFASMSAAEECGRVVVSDSRGMTCMVDMDTDPRTKVYLSCM